MPRLPVRSRWLLPAISCLGIVGAVAALGVWWQRATIAASSLRQAATSYRHRDWPGTEKLVREHLRSNPEDERALRLLARSLYRQGRDRAAASISERFASHTMEAEDDLLRGEALVRLGKTDFAIRLWRNALVREPRHVETRVALQKAFVDADRLSLAAHEAEQLAAEPGWEARAALMLGRVHAQLGDAPAAAGALERALLHAEEWQDLDEPERIRRLLASSLLRMGQPARARAQLPRSDHVENDPEASWLLSRCDLQEGSATAPAVAAKAAAYRDSHPMEPEPSPYLGEAACAHCHEGPFRDQHRSRQARTFLRKEQFAATDLPQRPIADPGDPSVMHTFRKETDGVVIDTKVRDQVFHTIVDYAFGSGDRGVTPVGHDAQGQHFEARLSRYHEPVGWDVTSGHPPGPNIPPNLYQGMSLGIDDVRHCMDCHNTLPRAILTGSSTTSSDSAIGCERCHGPGSNHRQAVLAKRAELAIGRPSLASGAPVVALCSECHTPRTRDLKLSPDLPASARFPGVALTWSRCYSESAQSLDCVTCHNPHQDLETSAAWYESRCLECHSAGSAGALRPAGTAKAREHGAETVCPVQPKTGCIACHMPRVRTPVSHTSFTDHFIRVRRDRTASEG